MQPAQSRIAPQAPSQSSKFRLIAELGRGGMATVYLAIRSGVGGFNKLQVVKQLHPTLAQDPSFLKMFLEEARLAARLSHPNIVQTYEIGVDARNHFIAMEYLEGPPLESVTRLLAKKPGEPEAAGASFTTGMRLRVLADVLAGLHYAHELTDFDGKPLAVVHRDVSPHNVIVTYDGHIKLVDFGIAKAADSSEDTQTGVMKGKAAYMAPERFGRGTVDARSDVFSVAAMMWHMLTGEKLWKGLSDLEIFQRLAAGQIPSPRTVEPSIPADLEAICMKGLALKVEDRYQSAAEMQNAIEDYLGRSQRVTAREIGAWVATHFAERRTKIKAIVEEQMKAQKDAGPLPQLEQPGARTSMDDVAQMEDPALAAVEQVQYGNAPKPGLAKAVRLLSMLAVLMIVGVAMVVAFAKQKATEGDTKPAKQATPFGNPTTPLVTLKLSAVPASAVIYVDDVKLPSNPSSSTMVRDGAQHRVRAEAAGFVTKREFVMFDSDTVTSEIVLEEEKTAAPKDPKAPAVVRPVGGGVAGGARPTAKPGQPTAPEGPATVAAPEGPKPEAPKPATGEVGDPTAKKPKKPGIDTEADPWK